MQWQNERGSYCCSPPNTNKENASEVRLNNNLKRWERWNTTPDVLVAPFAVTGLIGIGLHVPRYISTTWPYNTNRCELYITLNTAKVLQWCSTKKKGEHVLEASDCTAGRNMPTAVSSLPNPGPGPSCEFCVETSRSTQLTPPPLRRTTPPGSCDRTKRKQEKQNTIHTRNIISYVYSG